MYKHFESQIVLSITLRRLMQIHVKTVGDLWWVIGV